MCIKFIDGIDEVDTSVLPQHNFHRGGFHGFRNGSATSARTLGAHYDGRRGLEGYHKHLCNHKVYYNCFIVVCFGSTKQ